MSALVAVVLSSCLLLVTTVLVYVPQLLRLVRGAEPTGLSASSLVGGSVNFVMWSVYLSWSGPSVLLVVNVLGTGVWGATTVLALRRLPVTRACVVPLAWGAVLVTLALTAPDVVGPALGLGSLFTFVPQVHTAWTAPSVEGLSLLTWSLCTLQGVAWLSQSLPTMMVGGIVFGVIGLVGGAAVVVAIVVRGRATPTQDDLVLAA